MTGDDMARIAKCGCRQASCEKLHFDAHDAFTSAYFLELGLPRAQLEKNIPSLFTDPACGNVLRVKGFVEDDGQWYELNAAAAGLTAAPSRRDSRCSSSSARGWTRPGWKKT